MDGCINGCADIKSTGSKVSKIAVVHQRIWRKVSDRLVDRTLSVREELEIHKTSRLAFSGIGAEVIHWELEQQKIWNIPSIPTIARILVEHVL